MTAARVVIRSVMPCLVLAAACASVPAAAQVPDTVHLQSGERVVGHMAQLQGGILTVGTPEMGVVSVLWDKVAGIRSDKQWVLRTRDGSQRTGPLLPSDAEAQVRMAEGQDTILIALRDIVEMILLKSGFWPRIDGSLSVGFNHQAANNITQLVLGGNARYRGEHGAWDASFNSITTTLPGLSDNRRQDGSLLYERYLHRRWTSAALVGAEANTELLLTARWKANLMVGNRVLLRPRTTWLVLAGVQGNSERSRAGADLNSLEVFLGQRLRMKIPQAPNLELTADIYTTYGITVADRVRVLADAKLRYTLIKNVQVGIDFYEQFDSAPLDGTDALNDYRVAGTLSVTF
jgi:opacity protein-like surface antigen